MASNALDRLVGSDATLYKVTTIGAEAAIGNQVAGQLYLISKYGVDGAAVFATGMKVGDLWIGDAAVGHAFTATSTAKPLTLTELTDITSFTLEYNADEIEVTTLSDGVKKYRKGKTDMSGTVEGINRISEMTKAGSFMNRFMKVINTTAANVSTVNEIDNSALYCQFMVQKDSITTGESQAFLFAQVELFGTSLGAAIGDAQNWSSGVRIVGNDPILYIKANS